MQQVKHNNTYKMNYLECQEKNHDGEKLNLVCLEKQCQNHSLICSMCREGHHKSHNTTPLKFYIEQLKNIFESTNYNYDKELQQLQSSRISFLLKIQNVVQTLAEEFRKLQQDVINRFQLIRNQILEKQSRKRQFVEFYTQLINNKSKQPQLFMSQYLPKAQISKINNLEIFDKFKETTITQLNDVKKNILGNERFQIQPLIQNSKTNYLKPQNIKINGNIFTQSLNANLSYPSLCLLDCPFNKNFGKIRIKVQMLRKGGKLTLGFITKQLFQTRNYMWGFQKINNLMWLSNDGSNHSAKQINLKAFNQGSKIQIYYQQNSFIISNKKNQTIFSPIDQKQYYFFFSIQGKTQIQCTHSVK